MSDLSVDRDVGYDGAGAALDALRERLEGMAIETVPPFRANVVRAVAFALKVARSYAEDRERFVQTFKRAAFVPEDFDDIQQRALALWAAELELRFSVEQRVDLPDLAGAGTPLRNKMLRAAEYLWGEHPDHGPHVADIRSGQGYNDLADDLTALSALFQSSWAWAESRCDVTLDDLSQARGLGLSILRATTAGVGDADIQRSRDLRDRAAAWLLDAVEEVRAGAAYIFRDNTERLDAYPSLYLSSRRRPRPEATTDAPQPESTSVADASDASH